MHMDFFSQRPEAYGDKIPFIVTDLINELHKRNAADVEGIFRLAGSDRETKELISEFSKGQVASYDNYDVNTLATCLKRYFMRMSEVSQPLIPFELYACMIAIMKMPLGEDIIIQKVKPLLSANMPPSKYKALVYLCQFLRTITAKSETNRMTSTNLSICIGPNLLVSPESGTFESLQESQYANKALEMMIRKYDDLFGDVTLTESDICTTETLSEIAPGTTVNTTLIAF